MPATPFVRQGMKFINKKNNNQPIPIKTYDPLPVINKIFPNKLVYKRSVHHLWDKFYRVNFHSKNANHNIIKSYFIEINETNKDNPVTQY